MINDDDDDSNNYNKIREYLRRGYTKAEPFILKNGRSVKFRVSSKDGLDISVIPEIVFQEHKRMVNEIDKAAFVMVSAALHAATKGHPDKVEGVETKKIERPPGNRLIVFLGWFMSKKKFERTFGQTVADARQEFYEALDQGDIREAKKLKRELNLSIIKMCCETVAGWPADIMSSFFGKVFGKGE